MGIMSMEKSLATRLFEAGLLVSATIVPAPMQSNTYMLMLRQQDGKQEELSRWRSKEPRLFKTLEAASNEAARIGFKQVTVMTG